MNLILSHRQLDFDALASLVAAQKIYPDSVMVVDGKPNGHVQDFLALAKDFLPLRKPHEIDLGQVERVILVDTADLRRTGALGEKLLGNSRLPVEIYDHHPYAGPRRPGMYLEAVGACTTVLVEKLAGLGLPLTGFEATILALGIYDDTGSLLYDNTTVRDVRAVAYLLEQGAQLAVVAEYLRRPVTDEQKDLLQELLEHGQTEMIDGVPVYLSYAERPDYVGGLASLAHRIGELEGAETWFLAVKMENRLYLVGRSTGRGLPVHEIIQAFNGAGHHRAASATLKAGSPVEVLAKLRAEIQSRVRHAYLVEDIMSKQVKTVPPDTKLGEVEQVLLRYGHTGLPVVEAGRLIGIISRRDVEKAVKHGLAHAPVKGFMTTGVVTVEAKAPWEEAQRLMVQHDVGRLPVLEQGRLVGIVSRSDVLRQVQGSAVPIEAALARERSQALRQDILELLAGLPEPVRFVLQTAREVAGGCKAPVFLVGGFVRDLLMFAPTRDLDFVVEGSGLEFAGALAAQVPGADLSLHPEFGTAHIDFPEGMHVDVASTRWEYYAFPGALPQVEESCLKDDLFRRDFTINALAIRLNDERYGELIDYYGGLRDLQQGEIRLLHRLSFIDDPTRILRAVRFAERYRFRLAKETLEALHTALDAGVLGKLSRERFTQEFLLILQEENYQAMGRKLLELGVLQEWFAQDYPWRFDGMPAAGAGLPAQRWLLSLSRLSGAQIDAVLERLALNRFFRESTRTYAFLREALSGCRSLVEVDRLLAKEPGWLVEVLAADDEPASCLGEYLAALQGLRMRANGQVLLELGWQRGPEIGRVLRQVREAWLQGQIHSPEEEEVYLRHLRESGGRK